MTAEDEVYEIADQLEKLLDNYIGLPFDTSAALDERERELARAAAMLRRARSIVEDPLFHRELRPEAEAQALLRRLNQAMAVVLAEAQALDAHARGRAENN